MIVLDNLIFDLRNKGGVSKYWSKIIDRIDKTNNDITFIESNSARKTNFDRKEIKLLKEVKLTNTPVFLRRILALFVKSKVYHSSYFTFSLLSDRNIVTVHDMIHELYPNKFKGFVFKFFKKKLCKSADQIIAVSNQTKKDIIKIYKMEPEKVKVIHNGVDEEFYPDKKENKFTIKNHEFYPGEYFLYVGERGYCKNFSYVCRFISEYIKIHKQRNLIIAGGPNFTKNEKKEIKKMGLPENNIFHLKDLETKELRILYSNSLCLLIPSIYEGFGLPALEAARCKALVLSSKGGALEEILGPSEYAFDLSKKNDCSRVIDLGLQNESAKTEIERTYKKSLLFSWDKAARDYLKIYKKLLKLEKNEK